MFKLGEGSVIPGWEEGMLGMCVGESRLLVVPPHLAYGKRGAGAVIPAGKEKIRCLYVGLVVLYCVCFVFPQRLSSFCCSK